RRMSTSQGEDGSSAGAATAARQQLLAAVEQHCSNSPCPPGRYLASSDSSSHPTHLASSAYSTGTYWPRALTGAEGGSHFDRVEPGVTSWERRRWYLLRELLRFQPDILCLNEILYNTHRFECLQSETGLLIEPNEDGTEFLDAPAAPALKLLNPPATDDSDGGGELWVAATHLKAKVTFSNLRLLQTKARGIDYIWYRRLRPLALLEIPPRDSVESNGLPCAAFPSDHFCLSVDFCFCKN
uniref:Nocturnin n=1 Tax=Macrostomum lignano TaxID=282301 RepID=A0A1I8FMA1_9PLAT